MSLTFDPTGGVPVASATFVNVPASMSACVRVWLPLNVVVSVAPAASDAIGPPVTMTFESLTTTFVNVTFPVFVTANV